MFLAALELVLLLMEHLAGQQTKLSIFGTSYDVLRTEPSSYLFRKMYLEISASTEHELPLVWVGSSGG